MWPNSILSCNRLCPLTTTAATARTNRRPFTVSAKHARPQKNIKFDFDEEEIETNRELELLKQEEIGNPDVYASNSEKISGSAVLLALQKASAQKTSKKKKRKSKNTNDGENYRRKQGDVVEDYSDVKPLCIKTDWKDRLDELETQIHQLIHHI